MWVGEELVSVPQGLSGPPPSHHPKTYIKQKTYKNTIKNEKSKKKNKTIKPKKNHKTGNLNKNRKTRKQINQHINILSTNAAGLKDKVSDLKNKVKYFNSTIFAIQETHFPKKGRIKVDNFHIFEAIQKSKIKGGTMLGVHVDLQPVLVKEVSDKFELLVVEITAGDTKIRLLSGYGPQENWEETKGQKSLL